METLGLIYSSKLHFEPVEFRFVGKGKMIFKVTNDGKIEFGDGASIDDAARALFDEMAKSYGTLVHNLKAENERLREVLKFVDEAIEDYSLINARMFIDNALKEVE
jgi:hypothetical protein